MKKLFRIFLGGILLIAGCSQQVEKEPQLSFYDNGIVQSELRKNEQGEFDGICKWYYSDGKIKQECVYMQNKLDGPMKRYHENGNVQEISNYEHNYLNGKLELFSFEGVKIGEENYIQDTLNGGVQIWFPSGTLKMKGFYKDGLFEGKWTYFGGNGMIIGVGEFDRGSGFLKGFDDQGNLIRITPYKENLKDGIEKMYNLEGKLVYSRIYKNDFLLE